MPTYEYQCTACGHHLEAFQKMTDAPLSECPKCHQNALSKQISAAGFQLKGTGWYKTDYVNKPKPAEGASEKTAKSTETGTKTDGSTSSGSSQSGTGTT